MQTAQSHLMSTRDWIPAKRFILAVAGQGHAECSVASLSKHAENHSRANIPYRGIAAARSSAVSGAYSRPEAICIVQILGLVWPSCPKSGQETPS